MFLSKFLILLELAKSNIEDIREGLRKYRDYIIRQQKAGVL